MTHYMFIHTPVHKENSKHTHVFRFNMYIPYFENFFSLREKFDSYSEMLIFLISKYSERLQKIAQKKRTCRKIYQPKTNQYESYSIRITDAVHELLSHYSYCTGLSMSYLIRLILEWESGDYNNEIGNIGYTPEKELDESLVTTIAEMRSYRMLSLREKRVQEDIHIEFG